MPRQNIVQKSIKNKCLDFVKYHNGFVIGTVFALLGGGAIMAASPEAREAVLGKEIIIAQGVDNAQIINADLENFDFQMKIDNVTEDWTNYYVDYSFRTVGVEANVWQTIVRNAKMTVAKDALAGADLGLYVQAQLANIAQNDLAYLKLAQAAEREKGPAQIIRTAEYTGLIGLVLDVKNAVLPGYDPVVKPEPVKLTQEIQEPQRPETIQEIVPAPNATTTEEAAPQDGEDAQDEEILETDQESLPAPETESASAPVLAPSEILPSDVSATSTDEH